MIQEYLVICDFDGCVANTFELSPNGIGVNEAYTHAVKSVFGNTGLSVFNKIGRLENRAPGELVEAILSKGNKESLIQAAKQFFVKNHELLNGLVPEGKGHPLEWPQANSWNPNGVITEMLVRSKLEYLAKEIRETWPRPCKGILEFLKMIKKINNNSVNIQLAILSSGHEKFIQETFKVWGLPCPPILLTDDEMRGRAYPKKQAMRIKPSVTLFDLIHLMWFSVIHGAMTNQLQLVRFLMESRQRMIYFGDDPIKDGKLAEVAGVPFGWFNPNQNTNGSLKNFFSFNDWEDIANVFYKKNAVEAFKKGLSFREIISTLL